MGSMPSRATSRRPGAYPARSNESPSTAIWLLYTCATRQSCRALGRAAARTSLLEQRQHDVLGITSLLDFSGRILNSNRELPCGLRDIKKVRRSLPEPGFKGVTGRRAQPSAWTNSPKNSDGCRVPGTRSQERTIDCRGLI